MTDDPDTAAGPSTCECGRIWPAFLLATASVPGCPRCEPARWQTLPTTAQRGRSDAATGDDAEPDAAPASTPE
jgi:hypothetical protein